MKQKKTLKEVEGAVSDYEPIVRYKEFDNAGIAVSIFIKAGKYSDQYKLKHEFIKRLHDRLMKEKINISYPTHYVIHKKNK